MPGPAPAADAAATAAATAANSLGAGLLVAEHAVPNGAPAGASGTFVSPLSIGLALALLLNGAAPGTTSYKELSRALLGPAAASEANAAASVTASYEALIGRLLAGADASNAFKSGRPHAPVDGEAEEAEAESAKEPALILSIATSLWARPPLKFQPAFLAAAQKHLRASAHALTGAAPVNEWVSNETKGLIKDLVDEGAVARAVAVLVSALYFKGAWQHPFDAAATEPAPFTLTSGAAVTTPLMYHKFLDGQAAYAAEEGQYQAVRLPYRGGEFAALAVLPAAGSPGGAQGLLQTIAGDTGGFLGAMRWARVEVLVWMPRFKLECSMKLKGALQKQGVQAAFEPSRDFSRMLEGESELLVDEVVHKVFVEVNEKGTEAAAATAIMMMRCAMRIAPPPEVRFDRPFVFGVQHVATGALLFAGVVERPEAA